MTRIVALDPWSLDENASRAMLLSPIYGLPTDDPTTDAPGLTLEFARLVFIESTTLANPFRPTFWNQGHYSFLKPTLGRPKGIANFAFVSDTACCLEDDGVGSQADEACYELFESIGVVRQAECLPAWPQMDVQVILGNVDADEDRWC